MSIRVERSQLGPALAGRATGYLLSPGRDRPHVAAVSPRLIDGGLVIDDPGRSARDLARSHPAVTLLFPPAENGGYSLIVDGTATVSEEGPYMVTVEHAVLHRPADHAGESPPGQAPGGVATTSPTSCGHDCHPVGEHP